jgi:hypothetical protein
LNAIQARGYEIALLHILSPDEVSPDLSGDLQLIDVETGEAAEITLDSVALEEYALRLDVWRAAIDAFCGSRGIHYISITTSTPWEKIIMGALRRRGVVR